MTTTGYENRLRAEAPHLSRGQVKKLAHRLAKRAERMQAEFDFFAELRVLGITSDPTPRDAIRNIEGVAA